MNRKLRFGAVMSLGSLLALSTLAGAQGCRSNNQGLFAVATGGGAGATGTGGKASVDDGFGEDCTSDKQCKAYGLLCNPDLGCVECLKVSDCPAPEEGDAACNAGKCGVIIACDNSLDCPDDLVCDEAVGQCTECTRNADCTGKAVCVQGSCVTPECTDSADCGDDQDCVNNACETVTTCESSADCTGQVCDTDAGHCVDCLEKSDCGANQTCTKNQCVTNDAGTCDKPRVIVLVQRSGGMIDPKELDGPNWWGAVRAALAESGGLIEQFADELEVGVMVFYREEAGTCPAVEDVALPAQASEVVTLMNDAEDAYEASGSKVDAPFPEAIAAAQAKLASSGNPPFIVLLNASVPDTCTFQDAPCATDSVIGAVQDARDAGITTYVMGLEDPNFSDEDYYLQALANAGAGRPVATLPPNLSQVSCSGYFTSLEGEYQETGGNAVTYYAALPIDGATVKTGLESIFNEIAQTCD